MRDTPATFAAGAGSPERLTDQVITRAAATQPGNFAAVYNLGLVLEAQGRFQEAQQTFNQALMMMKTDQEIMNALARIQQKIENEAFIRMLMEREKSE